MTAMALVLPAVAGSADTSQQDSNPPAGRQVSPVTLSFYGNAGMVDMPVAHMVEDGELSFTTAHFEGATRHTLSFQITERLSGSFRYSVIKDFPTIGNKRYDRSFDLSYQLLRESSKLPAVTVGLRDFIGTGVYSGEYVVASKRFSPRFSGTLGVGWGRLGSYNSFSNPLGVVADSLETRSARDPDSRGGDFNAESWFRGDAALFGGVQWRATDQFTLTAEYSSDAYDTEVANGRFERRSPFNLGASYQFENGWNLGGYYLYGSEVGLALSYRLNPKHPPIWGGQGASPEPLLPRNSVAAASWGADWAQRPAAQSDLRAQISAGIAREGMELQGLQVSGSQARIYIRNDRYDAQPQAVGRSARVLANSLPPEVETFEIVSTVNGVPQTRVSITRSDLEELEFDLDGAWKSYARADVADAAAAQFEPLPGVYPRLSYALKPYLTPALFDPDNPVRVDVGAELSAAYHLAPGLTLSGGLRQPLAGNLDQSDRISDSVLPRVRSDSALYDVESDLELSYLTAEYMFRPGTNLYGRVTAGYLEQMYGGISGELLWKPVSGPLALGLEVNYAKQRDFDVGFGFQDYDIVTGHASAYYDFGNGFLGRVDAGRYQAGDWGATFALDREFGNGFRVGAFFTLTDVPFEDFGEGSFDKGIQLTIPLSWLSGKPNRSGYATTLRPVTRDGGARLEVPNRLYEVTRGYHAPELEERWGRFWR